MKLIGYFKKAENGKWALGQFNISNLDTLEAIFKAAKKLKSPVIIGTSERGSKLLGLKKVVLAVQKLKKGNNFPAFLNLDHSKSFKYIKKAADSGYDAVHFDGSSLSLSENIKIAKKVVKYARGKKVLVEGEVDVIGGRFTDSKEAARFVKETKVDSLAVNIGTIHGIKKSGKNPPVNLKKLREIKKELGRTPLVLHGGSGTAEKDVKAAIRLGVVKINISTDLKIAHKKGGPKAVQKVVEKKIKLFGSVNEIC